MRSDAKQQTDGLVADTKRSLSKIKTDLDDWYKFNYGSTPQKQTVIIKEELADFKQRQTYKNLDNNSRSQVLENRLILREFKLDLKKLINEDLKEIIVESTNETNKESFTEKVGSAISSPLSALADAALSPIQSMIVGAFERFGEMQVQDIAEGFNRKLQKSLGLRLETVGEDLGDIFGSSLYRTYESILKRSREAILSDVDDKTPQVQAFAEDFKNTLLAAALKALAMPVRAHKRIQMQKKAVPLAKQQAGEMLINRKVSDEERKSIDESNSITILTGGVTMDEKGENTDFVHRLMDGYLEDTHIVPVRNPWSNSKISPEYKQVAKKIIRNALSNPQIAGKLQEYLKSEDNEKILKELDTESAIDLNDNFLESVLDFLEKKDLPFIKVLETAYEGYNSDDVVMAATSLFYKQHFPDKPISIVGNSAGGLNAAGTMELLNMMGYEDIQATGISTPITGLEFTGDEDNYVVHLGDADFLYKAIYEGPLKDILLPPDYMNVLEGGGKGHMIPLYLADPNFQGRFAEQQKGRIGIAREVGVSEMAYSTRLAQYPEEENLLRTLKKYLGEEVDDGYYFTNPDDLKGLIRELKKKSKRIGNKQLKQEAQSFVDFIETLQKEMEIINLLGDEFKPVTSLQKAADIYPELAPLINKHQIQKGEIPEELKTSAQKELKENSTSISTKQKIKSESENVSQTLKALMGEEIEGYSFYDEAEYENRAIVHLGGLINHLENDLLKNANPSQKAKSFKYLDFLKRLQTAILDKGKYDIAPTAEFINEANELFSLSLDLPASSISQRKKRINSRKEKQSVKDVSTTIAASYQGHLEKLVEDIGESAKRYFNNNEERIEFDDEQLERNYQLIREKVANYRKAVRESNSQLAIELGEQLLAETAYYKQLYKGSSNESDNRKVGQLTRIQNEVLKGDAGRGRVNFPLSEIANQPGVRQLSIDFEDIGADVQRGFELGADGREAGEQFAEDVIEGSKEGFDTRSPSKVFYYIGRMVKAGFDLGAEGIASGKQFAKSVVDSVKNGLDINSPSRLLKWIGKMARIGFNEGVEGMYDELLIDAAIAEQSLRNTFSRLSETRASDVAGSVNRASQNLNDTPNWLDYIFDTEGADENIRSFFSGVSDRVSDFYEDLKTRFPILQRVEDVLGDIAGELFQFLGLASIGETLFNLATASLEAAMAVESLERSLLSVSANNNIGAENIAFIREEARRLNIELTGAMEAYTRIVGATRNTPLEGLQTQQIFTTLATTALNRGLSEDATSRLFLGFEQAIAKGEFKAEEVRGQLAEVLGDIQNLLANSVGVPLSQLSDLMEAGDLKVAEVMPKLLAQLNAQNAAMADSAMTAQASMTRLNNAVLEFRDAVGRVLQPVQKLGLNSLAAAIELVRDSAELLIKVLGTLITTILVNLALRFLAARLTAEVLFFALFKLAGVIQKMLPLMLKFIKRWGLLAIAVEVWLNNISLAGNAFPDLNRRVEASTKRLEALRKAFDDTSKAARNYSNSDSSQMQLDEGLSLPDNGFGKVARFVAGGDRLNLDNLVRKRIQGWDRFRTNMFANATSFYFGEEAGERVRARGRKTEITTQAQKKQADFVVGASDLMSNIDSTLQYGNEAKSVLEEVAVIDKRARQLQSQRNAISSGDAKALLKALEAEKEVLQKRDKLLEKTAQYQESLQQDIQAVKDTLLQLDNLDKTGGTREERAQRTNTRSALETRLKDLEAEKDAIDAINSRIPKFFSAVDERIRNSSERVSGLIANQEDDAVQLRNEIIRDAIAFNLSDTEVQLKIDDGSIDDLQDRISLIGKEISTLKDNLNSDYLTEGVAGLQQRANKDNLELTADTLQRMLEGELTTPEKKAADVLLQLDEFSSLKNQAESDLLDLIRNQKTSMRAHYRTIEDYFFNLTQKLKEARVETKTLVNQIFATKIKNQLRSALLPGSDSFINTIIDGIQGIHSQAQSLIERSLGIDSTQLQFESEARSLELEMRDFIRSVGGARDAVNQFSDALSKGSGDSDSNRASSNNSDPLFPLAGMTLDTANIKSDFGYRTIFGRKDFHEGIDIAVPGGTDVTAVRGGVVKYIKPLADQMQVGVESVNRAGQTVVEWFIHLGKKLDVSLGDRLSPGQKIGSVAHTTDEARRRKVSTGDHLDYRATVDGKWVDPKTMLTNVTGRTSPRDAGYIPYPVADHRRGQRVTKTSSISSSNTQDVTVTDYGDNQIATRALWSTDRVIKTKGQNINLQEILLQLDLEGQLGTAIANEKEKIRRQFKLESLTQENKGLDLDDKLQDIQSRTSITTAESEMMSQLRSTASEFRNIKVEGVQELLRLSDALGNLKGVVDVFPRLIKAISNSGNDEFISTIPVLQETLDNAIAQLPENMRQLDEAKSTYEAIAATEEKVVGFIERQGQLKIEAFDITKRTALQTIRTTIATQRGTNELRRQNEITSERLRLEQRINEIRHTYGDTDYADNLIQLERQQSRVNRENIDRGAVDKELEYEQKLLQLDEGIASSKGAMQDRLGAKFKGNKIRREAAIAQEDFRFQQEVLQLQRKYEAEPEKLELLIQKAEELNRVKLDQIKNQFGGLKEKFEELSLQSLTSFFEGIFAAFSSNGDKQRQLLEQELAYNKELLGLEEKYRDNPGALDFARDRVKKLNDEKLDKIKSEFNVFNRIVDSARQAVINLLKEIARMAAVKAASSILTSIIGGGTGSAMGSAMGGGTTTSMNFGSSSAISAFTASEGTTVDDRVVDKSVSSRLSTISPSIQKAFKREGSGGVLGVFTPGEEILSIKTGEAGRYQALKKKLGIDPLKRIFAGNFASGGTVDVEGNLLSQLRSRNPSSTVKIGRAIPTQKQVINNVTNFSASIVTPNADSFRESTYQRQQDIAEALLRAR